MVKGKNKTKQKKNSEIREIAAKKRPGRFRKIASILQKIKYVYTLVIYFPIVIYYGWVQSLAARFFL